MENNLVEKHSSKNIKKGAIIGYASLIINIISGFLFVPLILKQIGNQYGLFSLATSVVNLFLVDFGLSYSVNTFLTKKRTEGNTAELENISGVFYKLYFFLDLFFLLFFIGYYFLLDFIYQGLTLNEISDLKIVFMICIGYSLVSLPATTLDGTISAFEEYGFLKISDLVQRIVYILVVVIALYFKLGLFLFVSAHAISTIIAIVLKYLYVRYKLHIKANFRIKLTKDILKPIFSFSFWTAISSILARLPYNLSPNILGVVSDSNNVTVFGIASTIEGYAYLISAVISGFFLPKVSRILKQGENKSRQDLNRLSKMVGYIQLFVACLLLAGFIVCGKFFITLWLGDFEYYKMAYYGTILILFALILTIPLTIYNNAMYINGRVKELAIVDIVSSSIFVIFCFVFSREFGAFGACLAILLSKIVDTTGKLLIYKTKLGISILPFVAATYLKFVLPIILTVFIVLPFTRNNLVTWINFFMSALCCVVIYIPSSLIFPNAEVLALAMNAITKNKN